MDITKEFTQISYKTADSIISTLEELGFTSERKPSYKNELRDLIAIRVRQSINETGKLFYTNVSVK
jgi:hypothetical protein